MTTSDPKPVLLFDSGIGGLTVLREARVLMPERRFVYVADDAGFPYGGWDEEQLRERIVTLFGDLGCHVKRIFEIGIAGDAAEFFTRGQLANGRGDLEGRFAEDDDVVNPIVDEAGKVIPGQVQCLG